MDYNPEDPLFMGAIPIVKYLYGSATGQYKIVVYFRNAGLLQMSYQFMINSGYREICLINHGEYMDFSIKEFMIDLF
jgi:hypothetical protein